MKKRAVVVTTAHRGVFFGYANDGAKLDKDKTIVLSDARNCLYWTADVKGFLGLAVTGPSKSCRVGPAVTRLELADVTCVLDVTADAEKRWHAAPWG